MSMSKNITISDDAYQQLKLLKQPDESFTDVILRLVKQQGNPQSILETVNQLPGLEELADSIEQVMQQRDKTQLRSIDL